MFKLPFVKEIEHSEKILLSGAGGGFDVFGGIPLYFNIKNKKKEIGFASYSFTDLDDIDAEFINENCAVIRYSTLASREFEYFPEKILAEWLYKEERIDVPVYAFKRVGPKPLRQAYEAVFEDFDYDTIILIDGGTDSLLVGNESKLGSFYEDITSIISIDNLRIGSTYRSYVAAVGFGIDAFHGVSHYDVLFSIAEIIERGGFLGSIIFTKEMEPIKKYISLIEFANKSLPHHKSIVHNSIADAIQGQFGDYHSTDRTKGSRLFINPLMAQFWFFDTFQMVARLPYARELANAENISDVERIIYEFRNQYGVKRRNQLLL